VFINAMNNSMVYLERCPRTLHPEERSFL